LETATARNGCQTVTSPLLASGSPFTRTPGATASSLSHTLTYDALGWLLSATALGGTYSESGTTYDANGNMLALTRMVPADRR
jgi:hypothetical protein